MATAEAAPPSPFFRRHCDLLRAAARRGPVLDLACGRGRHALASHALGAQVVAADRDRLALRGLRAAPLEGPSAIAVDLESGRGWPFAPGRFGAVLVFRYLFRPLAGPIVDCLRPGGLLLYETFTLHQREVSHGPGNPAFLLEEGELARLFPTLEVLEYAEGWTPGPRPLALAQLLARKPGG
ncbi:MAG: methyltransferase domain-containing protein [Myxococcota bacterium]